MSITFDSGITILRNVSSLNGLGGPIVLTSTGGSITITPSGSAINLESAGGGGTFIKVDGTSTTTAEIPFAQGLMLDNTKKIEFFDSNAFINASSSGNLVVQGATSTTIGVAGNTSLGDGTLRTVYPNTDLKIDLGDGSHRFNALYVNTSTISSLTSGRVPYASTGGLLIDSSAFLFNGTKLTLPAATTSNASLNLPSGTAPSAPANGDVWYDGAHFQGRANGVTYQLENPGPMIVSTTTGIDAKATGTTTLYTVPAGKTAIITGAIVRCTAATAITVGPTLGIGVAAGEDDIFAATAITALTTTAKIFGFSTIGMSVSVAAAGVVKVGIDAASTGTSQTIAIDLIGYLL